MLRGIVAAIVLTATSALAQTPSAPVASQPFSVTLSAQDGSNMNQICTYAMDNATLSVAIRTSVGQFCLDLLGRLGKAQQASAPSAEHGAPSAPAQHEEKK